MKPEFTKTSRMFSKLRPYGDLKLYVLITSLVVVLLLLVSYLLAASQGTDQSELGLGLSGLPIDIFSPLLILIGGVVLSILLGAYTFTLFLSRAENLEKRHRLEVEKTKNVLLALASHQLRTPASGVKQYLGMVLEGYTGQLKPEQKQMLRKAFASNERQIETINQLLYVAQADAGELRLMPTTFNLTAKVKKVIQDLSKQAEERDIAIKFSRAKGVYVHGDQRFVRMIIENLISNAIKYSYESSVVRISVNRSGKQTMVKVKDDGVGIAEQDFPQLFLKFSRIENELSHSVGGSGIGLFLAQRLAKAHKGVIQVESTKTKGSTFTLVLPIASPETESAERSRIRSLVANNKEVTNEVTFREVTFG